MMSTGEGKTKELDCRHCVYKKTGERYELKTQKARQFIGEVGKRFPSFPFSLRCISDETCARVGVTEAKRHGLLHEYPALTEKAGEFVAQFKFTVLLLPNGVKKITGLALPADAVASKKEIKDEDLKALLATSVAAKKNKRNKKKKEAAAA